MLARPTDTSLNYKNVSVLETHKQAFNDHSEKLWRVLTRIKLKLKADKNWIFEIIEKSIIFKLRETTLEKFKQQTNIKKSEQSSNI